MRTFGIERERFMINGQRKIVPLIKELLPLVQQLACKQGLSKELFGFELFAGQIEDRTPPCSSMEALRTALCVNDKILSKAATKLNLSFDHSEFVETKRVTSFKVNPFSKRHQEIWASISNERRVAASVVAAVHVHISVNNEEALRILNLCREEVIDHLILVGNQSNFKRINTYRVMAETNGVPPLFSDFSSILDYIASKGGERNVWDLVRFKPSTKTIEFRMFGATSSIEKIIGYVDACRSVFEV